MSLKIKYYGTRGSIAVSGQKYLKFGGNTTCVLVEADDQVFIIDAGTGIRNLGNDLLAKGFSGSKKHGNLLFTHTHWDHIQGFPFFVPALIPGNSFDIYGETKTVITSSSRAKKKTREKWSIERALLNQQVFMYFPIQTRQMAAKLTYKEIKPDAHLKFDTLNVRTLRMRHPNNTLAFRFDFKGKSFVFCTDVEHDENTIEAIGVFARNADILAYDSQYTPEEYKSRVGWGHSTYEIGCEICKNFHIQALHMIHHDPSHDDDFLKEIEIKARKIQSNAILAYDGLEINF